MTRGGFRRLGISASATPARMSELQPTWATLRLVPSQSHSVRAAIGAARHCTISTVRREPSMGRAAKTARSPTPMPIMPLTRSQGVLALVNPVPNVWAKIPSNTAATSNRPRLALRPPLARMLRLAKMMEIAKKNVARPAANICGPAT